MLRTLCKKKTRRYVAVLVEIDRSLCVTVVAPLCNCSMSTELIHNDDGSQQQFRVGRLRVVAYGSSSTSLTSHHAS